MGAGVRQGLNFEEVKMLKIPVPPIEAVSYTHLDVYKRQVEDLFANVVTNGKFLYSAFYGLTNRDVMELFEEWGCRLKVERGNRVFPCLLYTSRCV